MEKGKRLFTKEKLDEFSKDFMGLAMEALENGDIEKAKHWIRKQDENKDALHDLNLHWVTAFMDWIYRQYGEEAAVRAIRDTVNRCITPSATLKHVVVEKGGIGAFVEMLVDGFRMHSMYPGLTIEEDDEKFIFTMQPCGSGGRLIDGGFYEGPLGYAKLKNAGYHTWGETDLPIYCAHCPWAQEILPIAMYGDGAQLWIQSSPFPKKPGDPCIQYIYKDPKDIPDHFYERIGMSRKPKSLPLSYGIDPEKNSASKK